MAKDVETRSGVSIVGSSAIITNMRIEDELPVEAQDKTSYTFVGCTVLNLVLGKDRSCAEVNVNDCKISGLEIYASSISIDHCVSVIGPTKTNLHASGSLLVWGSGLDSCALKGQIIRVSRSTLHKVWLHTELMMVFAFTTARDCLLYSGEDITFGFSVVRGCKMDSQTSRITYSDISDSVNKSHYKPSTQCSSIR